MISQALQATIERVVETADFRPLFDAFADDIELRVAIALRAPVCDERRGKKSVIGHLQKIGNADSPPSDNPPDFFASGERVVAFRDECFAIGGGLTLRSECALVFDVREGSITRLGIHHELSPVVDARPSSKWPARDHDRGPTDETVAMTIEA
jgi:ketosteroid isomerase-like protein